MNDEITDTPRPDACPHCGSGIYALLGLGDETTYWQCDSDLNSEGSVIRSELCREREKSQKLEAEVERLTDRMKKAEDLIKGLHDGWKKARKAHLETCKNAQTEIDRLYGTNVCLQESEAGWKTEADKADQRRLEAEAEVERLKANLRRAIAIADVLRSGGSRACRELHHSKRDQHEYAEVCLVEERLEKASEELDGLKAALNQDDK